MNKMEGRKDVIKLCINFMPTVSPNEGAKPQCLSTVFLPWCSQPFSIHFSTSYYEIQLMNFQFSQVENWPCINEMELIVINW